MFLYFATKVLNRRLKLFNKLLYEFRCSCLLAICRFAALLFLFIGHFVHEAQTSVAYYNLMYYAHV